jgi:predicted metal-dependent HD superfamily phosphohydrolase
MGFAMTAKPGKYGIEGAFARSWFQPGYWKTLARLSAVRHPEVRREGSGLHFNRYPFQPASVYPAGTVTPEQIAEVDLGWPSEIRLKNGDILFVPAEGKAALLSFVNEGGVRIGRRRSVWTSLLDPFLDTWEEQATIDRQFDWFASLGLDRDTVNQWRREVCAPMVAYNFGTKLWEWTLLGLYDVLLAQRAHLSRKDFADFYPRALRLAALDPVANAPRVSSGNLDGALFAVLLDWYPHEKSKGAKHFQKEWHERSCRIDELMQRLAAELSSAYSQSHRSYHTLRHIEMCLHELSGAWDYAVDLNEVRWALLFHDAVYDPHRQDNEARSADWACNVMDQLKRPEDEKVRIRRMILATAHSVEPQTPDEALLLDIDLSILGADEAAFDQYDRAIRAEYSWVPVPDYRQGRAKVLQSFLSRPRIYHTAIFRERYGEQARRNIERALKRLEEQD